ncbi:MAG: phosphate signaling complex PhoU family protein [Planctomycetota bacterium]|jgi:phosphate transport system protein
MSVTADQFGQRSDRLRADLIEQGRRVIEQIEHGIIAAFEADRARAERVIEGDSAIDQTDIQVERDAVRLLWDIAHSAVELTPDQLRMILTIVKVNNELERIADGAVEISERVITSESSCTQMPPRLRLMANSVLGILQNACKCFELLDTDLAKVVLASEDATAAFETEILRDIQRMVSSQEIELDPAFTQQAIAHELERVGDHCTNIAEQVIYVTTGNIVRHTEGHWTSPEPPPGE